MGTQFMCVSSVPVVEGPVDGLFRHVAHPGNIELVLNNEGGSFWHVLPPIPK